MCKFKIPIIIFCQALFEIKIDGEFQLLMSISIPRPKSWATVLIFRNGAIKFTIFGEWIIDKIWTSIVYVKNITWWTIVSTVE